MGLVDQLDGRADLFSVGAMMHALITGHRINNGRTEQEALVMAATKYRARWLLERRLERMIAMRQGLHRRHGETHAAFVQRTEDTIEARERERWRRIRNQDADDTMGTPGGSSS